MQRVPYESDEAPVPIPKRRTLAASPHASALDSRVLVLNRVYAAIRVISVRRAFALLIKDLAEVVLIEQDMYSNHDFTSWAEFSEVTFELEPGGHDWVHTTRFPLAAPRVLRLLGYDRLPRHTVKLSRRSVFARDRHQCQYCGQFFATSELSIDHVVPRSQGGGDTWENLVTACVHCNSRKGDRTPERAGLKLLRKPTKPKRNPLVAQRLGQDRYAAWRPFLNGADSIVEFS